MVKKRVQNKATKVTSKEKRKIKLPGIIAVLAIVLFMAGIVIYVLRFAPDASQNQKASTVTEPASSTVKKADVATPTAEEEGPYKGWQSYANKTWGISVRYPAGWTMNETSGSLRVTFMGPSMPPGGVILNECTFSIFAEDLPAATALDAYVNAARSAPQGAGDITDRIETSVDWNTATQIVDTYVDVGQPWKRIRVWTIKKLRAYTFTYAASPNFNKVNYYIMHEADAEQIMASIVIS